MKYYKLKESVKESRVSVQGVVLTKDEWKPSKEEKDFKNLIHLVDSFDGDSPPLIKPLVEETKAPKKEKKEKTPIEKDIEETIELSPEEELIEE